MGERLVCLVGDGAGGFVVVDHLLEVFVAVAYGGACELGHVVALHEHEVVLGVKLWKDEGFVVTPLGVEVGDVGAGVGGVVAAGGEYYPAAVAAPCVVAVYTGAVSLSEGAYLAGVEVFDVEVGAVVPDVELTVVAQCEEQVAAVGADAGHRDTLAHAIAGEFQVGSAKLAGLLVEGEAHEVVAQLVVAGEDDVGAALGFFVLEHGHVDGAVVELAAVGSPAGEGFEVVVCFEDVGEGVAVGIVEDEVRAVVYHFNLLGALHVEGLSGLVGGEDHPVACGVPGGIDGGGEDGVVLHVEFFQPFSVSNDGAAVGGAHVEEHAARVVVLIVVAVDAVVFLLVEAAIVLIDGLHVEGLQVALVEAELTVELVAGLDETVGEVAVDGLGGDVEVVGRVSQPASVGLLGVDADAEAVAFVLLEQGVPCEGVHHDFAVGSCGCH